MVYCTDGLYGMLVMADDPKCETELEVLEFVTWPPPARTLSTGTWCGGRTRNWSMFYDLGIWESYPDRWEEGMPEQDPSWGSVSGRNDPAQAWVWVDLAGIPGGA
jgi:hypothetical protein